MAEIGNSGQGAVELLQMAGSLRLDMLGHRHCIVGQLGCVIKNRSVGHLHQGLRPLLQGLDHCRQLRATVSGIDAPFSQERQQEAARRSASPLLM